MTYLGEILLAFDQAANAILGGYAEETLSSRSFRLARDGITQIPQKIINTIFFWEEEHCKKAHSNELLRRHLPRDFS